MPCEKAVIIDIAPMSPMMAQYKTNIEYYYM